MTKSASFTQAQVNRAIAAAKKAGLFIVGIRPDGTVIVYDGKRPIEEALRSALGCSTGSCTYNEWDRVLGLDEFEGRENEQPTARAAAKPQVPLEGDAWKEHIEKWKEWVRRAGSRCRWRRGCSVPWSSLSCPSSARHLPTMLSELKPA
jgi:hypothetical protein